MKIGLKNIAPVYLKDRDLSGSDIWEDEHVFSPPGKIHISAPSGTGKTSLALFLYGIRNSYNGKILFEGKNAKNLSINEWSALRQDKIAIIFQDLRLFTGHTGWENILIKAELTGHTSHEEIGTMADRLGIRTILQKQCHQMSQGERQRVAILRALVQPFSWLIMDEPFSHLDDKNINSAVELIKEKLTEQKGGLLAMQLGTDDFFSYDKTLKL